MQQVAVYIDYQNVYKSARRCFSQPDAPHMAGQIDPLRLALRLVGTSNRQLSAVRVYRGMPSSKHDPKGYSACQRQTARWAANKVTVITRPLNYRVPHDPKEKGIDVRIAIDMVMMAMRNEYDVSILFSGDTDLVPALEAVGDMKGPGSVEVAAWQRGSNTVRLRIPKQNVWCHLLTVDDYRRLHDRTDYTMP